MLVAENTHCFYATGQFRNIHEFYFVLFSFWAIEARVVSEKIIFLTPFDE